MSEQRMTTNETLQSLSDTALHEVERRTQLKGWRVSVTCSCDETRVVVWHLTLIHEFLKIAPGHQDWVTRFRRRIPDGLVDMTVNAAIHRFDQARAAVDRAKGMGA